MSDPYAEAEGGRHFAPVWLVGLGIVIVLVGGWYLVKGRDFAVAEGEGGTADPAVVGRTLYAANCAACHQREGTGVSGAIPPLAHSEWVLGDAGRLPCILLGGLQGRVMVRGAAYDGVMPSFWRLNDEQIAAILTYLRTVPWGHTATVVSPSQVAAARAHMQNRTMPWTEAELLALPPEPPPTTRPATNPSTRPAD